ncbi:hypothetical protein DL98DRAFT_286502 [Cadophora sp. DSE1049]|nr:hypothetical protein DL98DRAFT_286502 [Cadophora sp. DSE1049]
MDKVQLGLWVIIACMLGGFGIQAALIAISLHRLQERLEICDFHNFQNTRESTRTAAAVEGDIKSHNTFRPHRYLELTTPFVGKLLPRESWARYPTWRTWFG